MNRLVEACSKKETIGALRLFLVGFGQLAH